MGTCGYGEEDWMMIEGGWTYMGKSRRVVKRHYFVDGQFLCGRSGGMSDGVLDAWNDDTPRNCAVCRRKLAKLREEE